MAAFRIFFFFLLVFWSSIIIFFCYSLTGPWGSVHFFLSVFSLFSDWVADWSVIQFTDFCPLLFPLYYWDYPVSSVSIVVVVIYVMSTLFPFIVSISWLRLFYFFIFFQQPLTLKHFYDGSFKILVGFSQHLIHLSAGISWLSFLTRVVIFFVLGITDNFQSHLGHFLYVTIQMLFKSFILAGVTLFRF